MNAIARWLARLVPASLAKRLGASAWGDRSPFSPGQPRGENLRLWARSGSRCWPGACVPASSDSLLPEFRLRVPPPEVLGPDRERLLTVSLLQGASLLTLGERRVSLSGKPLQVRGPAIALQNSRWFPHPGRYCLVAHLGEQEVARFGFRLVSDAELGQAVRVTRVNIDAERRDGRVMAGLRVLRRQEHVAVLPSFRIEAAIPAPNTVMRCTAQTLQGTVVLASEEFLVPLDRPERLLKLQRIELGPLVISSRSKPTRLTLAIHLAGDLKAVLPFLLLPVDQIANAEGQLLEDAKDLPLDDLEYEQILNSLALPVPAPVRRRLWR